MVSMICEKCGTIMTNGTAIDSFYCIRCGNTVYSNTNTDTLEEIIDIVKNSKQLQSQMQKDKVYTLAYSSVKTDHSEQSTYLIDEDKKVKMMFYYDGYEGDSAKAVKGILDFLGVKCFECVYDKFPEKYREYKTYFRDGDEAPDYYF